MKKVVFILSVISLFLAFGAGFAIAEDGAMPGMKGAGDSKMSGGMMCEKMGGMMGGGMMSGGKMGGEMMMDEHHVRMILMKLGLDQKQMEAIDKIIDRTKKDMIRKKADKEIAEVDLKALLGKDPVDMKAVESKLKEIEAIRTASILTHIRAIEEGKALLTPEQKAKLKEIMQMHMMGGMMDKGGCCGDMKKEGGMMCDKMGGGMKEGDMKGDMKDDMKGMHHDHDMMMK